jgi:hypothetical protein
MDQADCEIPFDFDEFDIEDRYLALYSLLISGRHIRRLLHIDSEGKKRVNNASEGHSAYYAKTGRDYESRKAKILKMIDDAGGESRSVPIRDALRLSRESMYEALKRMKEDGSINIKHSTSSKGSILKKATRPS